MIETLLLLLLIVGILFNYTKRPKNFPPGPVPWPIVGSFHVLDHSHPQNTLDTFYDLYGPYVGVIMGSFKVLFVNGWKAINEVCANDAIAGRPDVCLIRDRFDGDNYGLIFTDGPNWKIQRRFTLHHVRNFGFGKKDHDSIIQDESDLLVEAIKDLDGKPFHFERFVSAPLLNTLWSIIGNNRYIHSDKELVNISDSIRESLHHIKFFGSIAIGFPFLRYIFPEKTGYLSLKRGSKRLLSFVQETIREHSLTRIKDEPRDFIDVYLSELEKPDVDPSFSEHQLEGICMDLLYAGGDTSLSVLCFAILFLCLRKDLQEKMYKEIQEYVGLSRQPNTGDRSNLVWTEAVIMEVLRTRTPAPNTIPHRCEKDVILDGYHIPKDTIVVLNLKSVLMDPNYWTDPENFRPERFVTQEGNLKKDERLIPFGKGKRNCMGETIAKSSIFIILSSLIQRFTFDFDPNLPVPGTEGVPGFTMAAPFFQVVATLRN